jgi:hypothetical protein
MHGEMYYFYKNNYLQNQERNYNLKDNRTVRYLNYTVLTKITLLRLNENYSFTSN